MNRRVTGWAVVAAAGVGAMLFAPVFGVAALVVAVVVPLVLVLLVDEAALRWPVIAPLRPLIAVLVGLAALIEVLFARGLPTLEAVRDFATAAADGWLATLESTWPARPEPRFLLFVPVLALFAAVIGLEIVRRDRSSA
ncbi:transglutaminase, partial [Umezawaea sp. NPDC059074]